MLLFAFLSALFLITSMPVHAGRSLYERIGGRETLKPMAAGFVNMAFHDPRLKLNSNFKQFASTHEPGKIGHWVGKTACEAAGGPCHADHARAHLRAILDEVKLSPSDWDALMADFEAAMEKFRISQPDRVELRALMKTARSSAVSSSD